MNIKEQAALNTIAESQCFEDILTKTEEELNELFAAIKTIKDHREEILPRAELFDLLQEMADVDICIRKINSKLDTTNEFKALRRYKLYRTLRENDDANRDL